MARMVDESARKKVWLIDSGCLYHMTGDESQFTTLDKSFKAKVEIGNGVFLEIVGTRTVAVEIDSGYKYITNVYLVPDANQNLLSVGQLTENHYVLLFKDRYCTIFYPKGDEVLTVEMKNKCYPIAWKHTEHKVFVSSVVDYELWHRRLGHINYNSLQKMSSQESVKGLPRITKHVTVCGIYQYEKQSRLSFPKEMKWKATEKLQLIHTDLGGPMNIPSLGGSRYFLLFIDDVTMYSWILFLKFKSEALPCFVKVKKQVENQVSKSIKIMRSNNGKEFTASEFEKFLSQVGVIHQLS
ncbi:Uncharacterized protein TCM_011252 [Theobroma cacao]|uniref:Integrase catalytic domain-containing protein n=1 Tax=Theobroma cacao TaxID=3641 RepID=A0A061EG98_THECC|nr:Uncharacterized protein TCM_011252 [Theobroma cacao]